jgi:cytochrome P450
MTTISKKKKYTLSQIKSLPIVGRLLPALRNPLGIVMDSSQRYGDLISFIVMGRHVVQLNHPDLIYHVLMEHSKKYKKSKAYIRFESAIGLGLLTSNGEKWKRDRQKIQPMFGGARVGAYYYDVVNAVSEKYKRRWLAATEHGSFELCLIVEMARLTTEVILKSIFGNDIDDSTVTSLHESYAVLIDYLKRIRVIPQIDSRKLFCLPAYFRFKNELDKIDRQIQCLAQEYQRSGIHDRQNLISLLVEAQKQDPGHFTDKDVRDHAVSMVFAGFESTSILMQWLWYVLDERADIKQKLRDEITQQAPCTATDDSSGLGFDAVQEIDYLSMVLKETMRLYPPFWMTGREPIEDDFLGDFKLTKGTTLILPQLAIHRHPDWWTNPNSFIPERFNSENEKNIVEGSYFPFVIGPRKCSGQSFVEMEAKTIIAKLLPHFDVAILNRIDNPMRPGISLKLRDPVMARVTRAHIDRSGTEDISARYCASNVHAEKGSRTAW